MKNLILTLLFVVLSVFSVGATTFETDPVVKQHYSSQVNDSIIALHVSVPCRIIFCNDIMDHTTHIIISDKYNSYDVYYTVENNTFYIKSNLRINELTNLQHYHGVTPPIVRIMTNSLNTPEIIAGSGFNIKNRSYEKATTSNK